MQTEATGTGTGGGAESWKVAKKLSEKYGYIPGAFTIAIRTLTKDHFENNAELQAVSKFQVARVLKTPSFKAMLYHASKDLHPEKFEGHERLNVGQLMDMHQPLDLGALIGCFLLYRKSRRMLGPDNWAWLEEKMAPCSQIGGQVGVAIPQIGVAPALLVSTLRYLAASLLFADNEKVAKTYLDKISESGLNWDSEFELSTWGCTTVEISTMILSTLGFGVDVSQAFSIANDPTSKPENMKPGVPHTFKMAWLWVDCSLRKEDQPMQKVPGDFYPLADARTLLDTRVEEIRVGKKHYLARGKDDLGESITPELFKKVVIDENAEFEVPEELQDVFSLDEITGMEEEDFDTLVDQMDADNESDGAGKKELEELEESVD